MLKKMAGAILMILGVAVFVWGSRVAEQADVGEERIAQAEENADGRRPTLGPVRRRARAEQSNQAQQRIGDEKQKVGQFAVTGDWLRGTGAVLFLVGLGVLVFVRK